MSDFLVIGAQESETTSLLRALRRTRGVWMPKGGTPVFEDQLCSEAAVKRLFASLL